MNIVVLTGAGISVPSGIPDFRSAMTGLWENHKLEEVATPKALKENHKLVWDFYTHRYESYKLCNPNAAHFALKKLEQLGEVIIITQNIDDLHEQAGSIGNVIHMHGTLKHVRNMETYHLKNREESIDDISKWRPNVVFFGESIIGKETIEYYLKKADLFLSIGTSNCVYPANMFHTQVPKTCKTVQLNKEETVGSQLFGKVILGDAQEIVPKYINSLIDTNIH